jgi:hypothetical protein
MEGKLSYYKANYTIYNVIILHEISLTKSKTLYIFSFLYNKKMYKLMMAYIKAETCRY